MLHIGFPIKNAGREWIWVIILPDPTKNDGLEASVTKLYLFSFFLLELLSQLPLSVDSSYIFLRFHLKNMRGKNTLETNDTYSHLK